MIEPDLLLRKSITDLASQLGLQIKGCSSAKEATSIISSFTLPLTMCFANWDNERGVEEIGRLLECPEIVVPPIVAYSKGKIDSSSIGTAYRAAFASYIENVNYKNVRDSFYFMFEKIARLPRGSEWFAIQEGGVDREVVTI